MTSHGFEGGQAADPEDPRSPKLAAAHGRVEAIAAETGRDPSDMTVRALARYVLEIPELAGAEPDPLAALNTIFDLLESGWTKEA